MRVITHCELCSDNREVGAHPNISDMQLMIPVDLLFCIRTTITFFRCLYSPSCLLAEYVAHFSYVLCSWSLNRELMETRAMQWNLKCHDLSSVTQFAPSPHLLIYWSKCVIKENNGGVHAEPSFYLQFLFFFFLPVGMSGRCALHWARANIDTTHLYVLGLALLLT